MPPYVNVQIVNLQLYYLFVIKKLTKNILIEQKHINLHRKVLNLDFFSSLCTLWALIIRACTFIAKIKTAADKLLL